MLCYLGKVATQGTRGTAVVIDIVINCKKENNDIDMDIVQKNISVTFYFAI